jgi:membrane protein YqaA with SNARE-associated domain
MREFVDRLVLFIGPLGGPGLAILAFLDSSFLSLPEVSDVLIVVLVLRQPDLWLYYAAATTIGSVAGCFALYSLARKGGEALLGKRFKPERLQRGLAVFRRFGLLAVIVPSILPPPTPFKIFVLLAGASGIRPPTFLMAVTIGRGFRYGSEALLTYLYGEQARTFIQANLPAVSYALAGLALVIGLGAIAWRHRTRRRMRAQNP